MRIAFDIGGVISKYPSVCRAMIESLIAGGSEVFVITDMHPRDKVLDVLCRNSICPPVRQENVYVADYKRYAEACKSVIVRDLKIDILVDDHGGYVAWPWADPAPMRLWTFPDPRRPYHAPDWGTDGSEGDFGRHAFFEDNSKQKET